jgi:hypothetical protein
VASSRRSTVLIQCARMTRSNTAMRLVGPFLLRFTFLTVRQYPGSQAARVAVHSTVDPESSDPASSS